MYCVVLCGRGRLARGFQSRQKWRLFFFVSGVILKPVGCRRSGTYWPVHVPAAWDPSL